MHIKKLKVRPQKNKTVSVCGPELASMLGCWAATNDVQSVGACAAHAQTLFACMRTTPFKGKQHRPTINYHLARLGKNLK
ncbi:hypothetical protein FA95DRAFT_1610928 [Auriscalpium vulgare]|uniref:Uncharacterized protein n=1 Tax=Auriscalpium vulgare TaxID=40419 RepID=A0ACB8RC80_9AGAM|nr:hypothetical protein FA95DRAFT_1610928 [Auriscalpium vulgare]